MSASPYSTIYAFGDSLSDAGNVSVASQLSTSISVSPPYFHANYSIPFPASAAVFSNGPTWVQDLSITLNLGTLAPSLLGGNDFAYGGAQTGPTPQNASNPLNFLNPLDLPAQLTEFQTKVSHPSAAALYTLSIGGNDVINILSDPALTPAQQSTDITAAITNTVSFLHALAQGGARHVLVMNVTDLGLVPVESGKAVLASSLSIQYDSQLATALATEAASDALDLHILDARTLLDAVVANPAGNGLTNVTTPVWSGNFTSASSGTLAATGLAAQDQFLFWDKIHPTETGQKILASNAAALVLPCFAAGTRILTVHGEIPVEHLRKGDALPAVAGFGLRRIVWIGRMAVRPAAGDAPVRVRAGAFGPAMPHRDLVLSPDHALYRDSVLIPVHLLADGNRIHADPMPRRITYFHVELDRHDAILAEGLPAESYLDTGNRSAFLGLATENIATPWDHQACAPLHLGGSHLALARRSAAG